MLLPAVMTSAVGEGGLIQSRLCTRAYGQPGMGIGNSIKYYSSCQPKGNHATCSTHLEHRLCMLVVNKQLQPFQHSHTHCWQRSIKRQLACKTEKQPNLNCKMALMQLNTALSTCTMMRDLQYKKVVQTKISVLGQSIFICLR